MTTVTANPKVQELSSKIPKIKKPEKKEQIKETKAYYSQDYINIDDIVNNTVFLNNGKAVGIMEVIPINFFQLHNDERNNITDEFQNMFRIAPVKLHIKIRTEKSDISKIIWNIRRETENETDPVFLEQVEDYIQHIKQLQGNSAISQKFYIIYEYEGDVEGNFSKDKYEIADSMDDTRKFMANTLRLLNNIVPEYSKEEQEYQIKNLLYKFYNPISYEYETLEEREKRIYDDEKKYNDSVASKYRRQANISDVLAPRGLDLKTHASYITIDGEYQTFIAIRSIGFPPVCSGSWITRIAKGPGIDYDIFSTRLPHDSTVSLVEQMNRWNRVSYNEANRKGKYEKTSEISGKIGNINGIVDHMRNNDEDLFFVMVMITVRSPSYKIMMKLRNGIVKALESRSIYTINSFLQANKFFQMSQPLMNFDQSLFNMCRRNFLTSSMASLYCFTAYELFNDKGYVIGTNAQKGTFGSLISFNNFDTSLYANANILIIGTSGAGKTFTEQMLAYRMRMTGVRTIFITPTKGRIDYYRGCKNIGGEFITLSPSSENHINIMAIRPASEEKMDKMFDDDETRSMGSLSLLSSKINSIIIFIGLLMQKTQMTLQENSLLGVYLSKLYTMFGITDDNDSIWLDKEKRELKQMPILEDLMAIIDGDPKLENITLALSPIVNGNYQSLNAQTNVDLTNRYIVFDVDDNRITEDILPAFLYVAFDCAYSLAKEDIYTKDAVFLDEVWKLMVNEDSAKQVQNMVKLIRAYGACTVMATQDLEDFLGKTGEFGAAVINNTENKIFMRLKEKEVKLLAEHIDFTPEEKKTLQRLDHQGMIYSGTSKIICNFIPSDREEEAFTTDINRRNEIREKRRFQALARENS